MKTYFINYATDDFQKAQIESNRHAIAAKFEIIKNFGPYDIDPEFRVKHMYILSQKRGAGACLWKPYFILDTLREMDTGDLVVYMDSSDMFSDKLKEFIINHLNENGQFIIESQYENRCFTRRNCFKIMGCDSEKYWGGHQIEAGCIGLIKNRANISLVKRWLRYCTIPDAVIDIGYGQTDEPNFGCYIRHSSDQSILSNLVIRDRIKTVTMHEIVINGMINYNLYG